MEQITNDLLANMAKDPSFVSTLHMEDLLKLDVPSKEKTMILKEVSRLKGQVIGAGPSGSGVFIVAPGWRTNSGISEVGLLGLRYVASEFMKEPFADYSNIPDTCLYGLALRFPKVEIWYKGNQVPNYWDLHS